MITRRLVSPFVPMTRPISVTILYDPSTLLGKNIAELEVSASLISSFGFVPSANLAHRPAASGRCFSGTENSPTHSAACNAALDAVSRAPPPFAATEHPTTSCRTTSHQPQHGYRFSGCYPRFACHSTGRDPQCTFGLTTANVANAPFTPASKRPRSAKAPSGRFIGGAASPRKMPTPLPACAADHPSGRSPVPPAPWRRCCGCRCAPQSP